MVSKLYHPEILRLNDNPYHFERKEREPWIIANNPFCGDRFKLFKVDKLYYFFGHGCAVSKASTSILIELLEMYSGEEMKKLTENYIDFIQGVEDVPPTKELAMFSAVRDYPARQECALLSWKAYLKWWSKHASL